MTGFKSHLDIDRLRYEIQRLNSRKELYHVLKEELSKLGHWKALKRGKPRKWDA